jgi:hypothetical protein
MTRNNQGKVTNVAMIKRRKDWPATYPHLLADLKTRIRAAQIKAALSVNRELVQLYWDIGRRILENQQREGWGAKVIERLAEDLTHAFPETKGFSPRNLKYMRAFAEAWPDSQFVQQVAAQIAAYKLTRRLPAKLQAALPTPALLKAALNESP